MASNLSSIGFVFADAEEFQRKMIELAATTIERIPCDAGDYSIWRSRTGAEIWFHLPMLGTEDDARDIAGLTPYYEGLGTIEIEITARANRQNDNLFEGAFTADLQDPDGNGVGNPLTFDAVDFAAHATRELPFRTAARIACFARQLRAYPDEASYLSEKSGPLGDIGLAARACVPLGHFAEKEECGEEAPESTALITGRIAEARRHTNEATGHDFFWLLVESLEASFDVVADPDIVDGEIVEGGTVLVSGILIGRLLPGE